MYNARDHDQFKWFHRRRHNTHETPTVPEGVSISIRNLGKTFNTNLFGRSRGNVTAIEDLTMDIPKNGITVLLGSNGFVVVLSLTSLLTKLSRIAAPANPPPSLSLQVSRAAPAAPSPSKVASLVRCAALWA